jgi:hypothetical protein
MSAAEEAPERAREIGAVGCLAKPFAINELLSSIEGPLASLTVVVAA